MSRLNQIEFNAARLNDASIVIKLAEHVIPVDQLQVFHNTRVIVGDVDVLESPGCWTLEGRAAGQFNDLTMYEKVSAPVTGYVNLYKSSQNDVGFTVGSEVRASREDMQARGQRNQSGNYLGTVAIEWVL